jgi:pimeloyl-ACP methyl ester carboxylesterase
LKTALTPVITDVTSAAKDANFAIPGSLAIDTAKLAIGSDSEADVKLWAEQISKVYVGDVGRQKLRQAILSALTREGLHLRLADLKLPLGSVPVGSASTASSTTTLVAGSASLAAFPILLIRGSKDTVFSTHVAEKDVLALEQAGIKDVTVQEIEGGAHAVNWSHAKEVNALVEGYLKKYGGRVDARALREAVGMVDI